MPARSRLLPVVAPLLLASLAAARPGIAHPPESGSRPEPIRIRVLSYNINHGEGVDSRTDLNRITAAIRAAAPDVVALQEVDRGMARTGRIDQARLLAGRLDLHHAFGGNLELFGGSFGNAILSRFPIAEHRNHPLPSPSGGEPKGALEATLTLPGDDGPSFRLISTQLDHRRDDGDRLAAAEWLAGLADAPGAPPSILAGDLNAGPGGPVLRRLTSRWAPITPRPLPTVPAHAPSAAFDHVLIAPVDRWRVVEVRVLDEPEASDHRPILAVLEWLPEPSESPPSPSIPAPDAGS